MLVNSGERYSLVPEIWASAQCSVLCVDLAFHAQVLFPKWINYSYTNPTRQSTLTKPFCERYGTACYQNDRFPLYLQLSVASVTHLPLTRRLSEPCARTTRGATTECTSTSCCSSNEEHNCSARRRASERVHGQQPVAGWSISRRVFPRTHVNACFVTCPPPSLAPPYPSSVPGAVPS